MVYNIECSVGGNALCLSDTMFAVVAELADAHGSGPCGKPWGFESLRPHQVMRPFRMHSCETQSMTGFQRFLTANYRVNHCTDLGMQNGFFCEFRDLNPHEIGTAEKRKENRVKKVNIFEKKQIEK